jgi:hypothetical protein
VGGLDWWYTCEVRGHHGKDLNLMMMLLFIQGY